MSSRMKGVHIEMLVGPFESIGPSGELVQAGHGAISLTIDADDASVWQIEETLRRVKEEVMSGYYLVNQ